MEIVYNYLHFCLGRLLIWKSVNRPDGFAILLCRKVVLQ